jgi:hypothetical protein
MYAAIFAPVYVVYVCIPANANIIEKEQKKNLHVATTGYFQSYAIADDLSLAYENNVSLSSTCEYISCIELPKWLLGLYNLLC